MWFKNAKRNKSSNTQMTQTEVQTQKKCAYYLP